MEVKQTVCQKETVCVSAACIVVQDENATTENRDGEQKVNLLHGQTKGLFSCLDGIVQFFQQIFSRQDADGDDENDPLLENPNVQGEVQVESGSTDLGGHQNGSTAESRGLFQELLRKRRGPKSPVLNPGSGPQHN